MSDTCRLFPPFGDPGLPACYPLSRKLGFLSISDSDRRVPAELGQERQSSLCVEEWNSACLSSGSRGDRPLVELSVVSAGFSERCMRVAVPLLFVPSSTGLPSNRCLGIGFLSRADREIGVFWHVAPYH